MADGGPEATCTPGYDGPPEALFPTFADADTVLLWTFDDPEYPNATLTDASGNEYDLRLMDGGDLAPGVYGTALHFASRPGYEASFAGWQAPITNERMREEDGVPSGEWSPTVAPKHLIDTWACGAWTLEMRLRMTDIPTCLSSNKWNKRSDYLMESFAHHFHITRRVVDSANDVSRSSFS
ncbi:MAG: hypothetical protein OEN23_20385 [Paracoccaceae bacterium]|nr:hypothetical protein [Paracoccaceae bacterium]